MIFPLQGFFRRVMRAEEGSVAIIVGLLLFILIMAVGVAVDMARAQILQQRMSASLDAAGLAAAETVTSPPTSVCSYPVSYSCSVTWANQEAGRYFQANFPSGYLGSTIPSPTVTLTTDLNTLTLNVAGTQQPMFMQTFGVGSMSISANSTVTRSNNGQGMEVVLALDNTYSMNGPVSSSSSTSKIVALQSAATALVAQLLGTTGTPPANVWIGIVPFTQGVNAGGSIAGSAFDGTTFPFASSGADAWAGCVTSRSPTAVDASNGLTYDLSDAPPSPSDPNSLFEDYFFASAIDQSNGYVPPSTNAACNADDLQLCYYNQWQTSAAPTYNFSVLGGGSNLGPNAFCPQPVIPMTSDTTTLDNAINSMTPVGDTEIDIGLAWGWRMLSPRWQGLWSLTGTSEMQTNNLPLPYNATNNIKVLILVTDGTNYLSQGDYSAYGMYNSGTLGANYLGATYSNNCPAAGADDPSFGSGDCEQAAGLDLDARTLSVCQGLKNAGVIVYTIGFGTPAPDNPPTYADRKDDTLVDQPLLQSCAGGSNPSGTITGVYLAAPDNATLQADFQQIAQALEYIRISK